MRFVKGQLKETNNLVVDAFWKVCIQNLVGYQRLKLKVAGQHFIVRRKQAATRAVLTPLETRLTAAFATLTGDNERGVFLDENLQIAGVGRTRDESHSFDLLSQGAREQLLLCLRIAVAQELAADEPQVLILDDVLVNTDLPRQERVIEMLTALAPTLQVIILTCHADWYRGVGTAVTIVPQADAN